MIKNKCEFVCIRVTFMRVGKRQVKHHHCAFIFSSERESVRGWVYLLTYLRLILPGLVCALASKQASTFALCVCARERERERETAAAKIVESDSIRASY